MDPVRPLFVLAAFTGHGFAEPPPADPGTVDSRELYPRDPVLRPLLLPHGAIEASALAGQRWYAVMRQSVLQPAIRFAVGPVEIESSALFAVEEADPRLPPGPMRPFPKLFVAIRYGIDADTSAGAELQVKDPLETSYALSPRAVVARRWRYEHAAMELSLNAGFDRDVGDVRDRYTFAALGGFKGQLRGTPRFALEARALLGVFAPIDWMADTPTPPGPGGRLGAAVIAAVTEQLDLIGSVETVVWPGHDSEQSLMIGIIGRRIP